jgi:hypothetical protein
MKAIIDENSGAATPLLALVDARATSNTGVDATFSSAVELAGAQKPRNYSIKGLGVVAAAMGRHLVGTRRLERRGHHGHGPRRQRTGDDARRERG